MHVCMYVYIYIFHVYLSHYSSPLNLQHCWLQLYVVDAQFHHYILLCIFMYISYVCLFIQKQMEYLFLDSLQKKKKKTFTFCSRHVEFSTFSLLQEDYIFCLHPCGKSNAINHPQERFMKFIQFLDTGIPLETGWCLFWTCLMLDFFRDGLYGIGSTFIVSNPSPSHLVISHSFGKLQFLVRKSCLSSLHIYIHRYNIICIYIYTIIYICI